VAPGHLHDLTVARDAGVIGALNCAAAQLGLPTLADSGYEGAGQGIKTPVKQPADGQVLAPDNQAYNTLLRSTRCLGERGFALLTAAGEPSNASRSAPAESANSPKPRSCSHELRTSSYALLVEITSVCEVSSLRMWRAHT